MSSGTISFAGSIERATVKLNSSSGYTWTGTGGSYYVYLVDSSTSQLAAKSGPISSFAKGSAEIEASGFTPVSRLTITDIYPALQGWTSYTVYVHSSADESSYASGYEAKASSVYFYSSPDETTITLYTSGGSSWTGTGSYYVFLADSSGLIAKSGQIAFSDGSAALDFSNLTLTIGLTITGVDTTNQSGTYKVYVSSSGATTDYKTEDNRAAYNEAVIFDEAAERIALYTDGVSTPWINESSYSSYYLSLENSTGQLVARRGGGSVLFQKGRGEITAASLTPKGLEIPNLGSTLSGKSVNVYVSSNDSLTYAELADTHVDVVASTSTPLYCYSGTDQVSLVGSDSSSWTGGGSYHVYLKYNDGTDQVRKASSVDFAWGSASVDSSTFQ
jgi:hypothetical protein